MKGTSKRDKYLQIRMTVEELELLDDCVKELQSTRTDVVNQGIRLVKDSLGEK
mgnify:CR=1 FL=1